MPKATGIGYVCPPSVENQISTLGLSTGATSVPATSQVTVSVSPMVQVVAVVCEVTTNGPEPPSTTTAILSLAVEAPPATLSRTVYLKFIVLPTEGTTSQVLWVFPANTVGRAGIYLSGSGNGSIDLKAGPRVEVFNGGMGAGCAFICSQLCVRMSPASGSVAIPFKIKGVDFGMVTSGPASAVGGRLFVAVCTAH